MGNILTSWYRYWMDFPQCKILMVGLDAAGKTTILHRMKFKNEETCTIPTIGFNVESFVFNKIDITMWDIGGRDRISKLWSHYYAETQIFVFVVDSNDSDRLEEAKERLGFLNDNELQDVIVLVFANKQDLPRAKSPSELVEILELNKLTQNWFIQPCCAFEDQGLHEGFNWISEQIMKKNKLFMF